MSGRSPDGPSRILIVHPSSQLYGSDRVLIESVRALCHRGWDVTVLTPSAGPLHDALEEFDCTTQTLDTPVLKRAFLSARGIGSYAMSLCRATPSVIKTIRHLDPDVVYVNTVTLPLWTTLARLCGRPVALHVHEAEDRVRPAVARLLYAQVWAATATIANSAATKAAIRRAFPRSGRRVATIHNGIQPPARVQPPRDELTAPIHLVLLGRISHWKGTDIAVSALKLLLDAGHEVVLTLVGSTPPDNDAFANDVRSLADDLGVSEQIVWFGESESPWQQLADSDIALAPSRLESFGNAAAEAMLAQRPIVAALTQGLAEVVHSEEYGELVPPDDPHALADGITRILDDWPRARRRAKAGQQHILSNFAPERFEQRLDELLTGLTGRRSRPRRSQGRRRAQSGS